jgi:S1-C subfamily serine protease
MRADVRETKGDRLMPNEAEALSQSIARAVSTASPSVVRVVAGRYPVSGVVWDESGHVLTVAHALPRDTTESLEVVDADGTSHEAMVVGRDSRTDVAVLSVKEATLPPLAFRELDDLATGHLTVALGRPGRAVRASLRIVGLLGPALTTPGGAKLDAYVETDRGFPIGFSGGPLVDLEGRAIGLDTDAILRGADLTVPTVTLRRIADAIIAHGGVERGYLGVSVRPVHLPDDVRAVVGRGRGALLLEVEQGGPAAKSGLVLGDVIVELDGEAITGPRSLSIALVDRAGRDVPVKLLRAGALQDHTVNVGARR